MATGVSEFGLRLAAAPLAGSLGPMDDHDSIIAEAGCGVFDLTEQRCVLASPPWLHFTSPVHRRSRAALGDYSRETPLRETDPLPIDAVPQAVR